MTQLEIGTRAPEFTLPSTTGETISLAQLCERASTGVIVYFYPKASTPGCTRQACDFRDSLAAWRAAGYEVVGISPDPVSAQERFTERYELPFPMLSDPEHEVMEAWGAWGPKKNYGRLITGTIRSTIVVDTQGVVTVAQYNVKATGHVARLRRALGLDAEA